MVFPATRQAIKLPKVALLALLSTALLVLACVVSMLMHRWDLDMAIARCWHLGPKVWFGDASSLCRFLNEYGPLPGVLLAASAFLVLLASAWVRRLRRLSVPALYLVLAFLLGPGLLVNGVLKHSWSRSRPRELVEFGGKHQYERIFTHVQASQGRSFPSGHASTAFFLGALGFAAAAWGSRRGMWMGLALGAGWGILVSWSRMASGAHFLTDVMWSGVIVTAVNFATLLPFVVATRVEAKPKLAESFA